MMVAFEGFVRYIDGKCGNSIDCIFVGKERFKKSSRANSVILSIDMVEVLGFARMKEYLAYYPGSHKEKSFSERYYDDAVWRHNREHRLQKTHNFVIGSVNSKEDLTYLQNKLNNDDNTMGLMYVPTMAELKECYYFKRRKNIDMWFCSDWTDDL